MLALAAVWGVAFALPLAPTSPAVGNVVFTLVRADIGHDDLRVFLQRSNCLQAALKGGPLYDQIAFHEGDISADTQKRVKLQIPGLRFVDARTYGGFQLPDALDGQYAGSLGYRHMVNPLPPHHSSTMRTNIKLPRAALD